MQELDGLGSCGCRTRALWYPVGAAGATKPMDKSEGTENGAISEAGSSMWIAALHL